MAVSSARRGRTEPLADLCLYRLDTHVAERDGGDLDKVMRRQPGNCLAVSGESRPERFDLR